MELKDYIYIAENVLPSPDKMVQEIESIGFWQQSLVDGKGLNQSRRSKQMHLDVRMSKNMLVRAQIYKNINTIRFIFKEHLTKYLEQHKDFCTITQDEGLFVLKYDKDDEYKAHSDGDTGKLNRRVSGLLYLNEGYEGGELYFPNMDVKIRPTSGMLILFPSNFCFPHASLPITNGTKYTIVTWFR